MTTLFYSHLACVDHRPGGQHPERPERLQVVMDLLAQSDYDALLRRKAPPAEIETLSRAHRNGYIDATLDAIPKEGRSFLDPDTAVSPGSRGAALRAAGAAATSPQAPPEYYFAILLCCDVAILRRCDIAILRC